jgi:hypothetical protein
VAIKRAALLGLAFAVGVLPVAARHSFAAEFDASKTTRITGVISKVDWTNPVRRTPCRGAALRAMPSNWAIPPR